MNRALGIALSAAAGLALLMLRAVKRRPLPGKVVLITGGSRGLGLELARRCLERGAKGVAIVGRDAEALERARQELGPRVRAYACDLTDAGSVRVAVARTRADLGPVDVLIHSAGIIAMGPAATMAEGDYRAHLDTHLFGAIHAVDAVLPEMRARRQGSIALVHSVGGKIAVPHLLPYSASKFALAGYAEGLHAELAEDGICVTSIAPRLMRTGSPRNADFKGQHQKEYAWFMLADSLPLLTMSARRAARAMVSAIEHARAELFLLPFGRALMATRALFPELSAAALSLVSRLLPRSLGAGAEAHKGRDSESSLTRSPLTALTRRAEARNNQLGGLEALAPPLP